VEADPTGSLDHIKALRSQVELAISKIEALPEKERPKENYLRISREMTINSVRLLLEHSISVSGTASADYQTASVAVEILWRLGRLAGLPQSSKLTWRDRIREVKARAKLRAKIRAKLRAKLAAKPPNSS
jgi:predicted translin family RNA/ssDNA-binding protein